MTNQQSLAAVHHAIVKSIFSGDTLVIKQLTRSPANETEQRISLNYITAPKLARPPIDNGAVGSSVDEPYAFETREFLRKKLVGREICYTVDFQIPQSNRSMCTVYLGKDKETGENIIESLLSEGLVDLRQQTGQRAADPKYQRLVIIDEQAKANKRGRYSDHVADAHVRNIKWTLDNPKQFVDELKSQPPMDAIVEFVRDGNTVRCLLMPSYHLVTVQLTGIKCPMLKREGSSNETNEPFAEEAKQFVDTRLLQRQVKVILDGVNNQNLVGTLLHPNGNIALHLLKEGLAKCVDWSLTLLQPGWREKYRATEKYAKDSRLRIWKNYVPQTGYGDNENNASNDMGATASNGKSNDPSLKGYQAKVLEVMNGDALTIRDLRDNKIRKVYLSSVRAPRAADLQQKNDENNPSGTRQQIKRPLYEIPYLFEARELLRKRLVGKAVRVVTDYVQPASDDYPEKICCTVYAGNVNLGEALISKGLAKAVRHRQDDEKRSSHYDDLLTAEQQAEKRGVGIFSNGGGLQRIVDMTGESNKERAKGLLSVLQRNGRMEGVVEFVASGSRFRVHLLKDNWIVSFLLSSINCPRAERRVPVGGNPQQTKVEAGEPFGAEALTYSKEHFLQRDVFVEVESMDRGGNFIGRLTTVDGNSASFMLVQAGLAKVHESAYGAPNYKQLIEAEEKCRKERIGVWTNYEEPTAKDEEENETENVPEVEEPVLGAGVINFNDSRFRRVVVTYVTPELKVYVQYAEQGAKVEQLQTDLREIFSQTKPVGGHSPKKGELLAARFTADNEWYRARVEKIEGNNRISVYFIDYGNRELITDLSRLTQLPPGFSQLPGQAHECDLAYVRAPPDEDDRQFAKNALLEDIDNQECIIKVEYRQNNSEHVSLYRAITKENLVKTLVDQGLIVVIQGRGNRQLRLTPLYDELLQAQAKAKSSRIGLWQYSDQIEDDATEFGFSGRK
ncbi:unnamed protein product [Rotaria socialis]|uniref:Staphylococcal nuclease domain-containing protein 1 n=2 Tax=Rotaria socialis TaxID=392032 RepID=A0A818TH10_9BILA|nr:unnamed protein product [Rotaria socialis]CAF3329411.1 unnamed protein product [Rotaria socialis]CAF3469830.1 unnamed protein product [Rotaria socialis]CAF3683660.1 unnamed protein product [Rotaria socialis]CAF4341617.1 unnamed protein product [Rotaria socialis]